jgi:hypothetical protein
MTILAPGHGWSRQDQDATRAYPPIGVTKTALEGYLMQAHSWDICASYVAAETGAAQGRQLGRRGRECQGCRLAFSATPR